MLRNGPSTSVLLMLLFLALQWRSSWLVSGTRTPQAAVLSSMLSVGSLASVVIAQRPMLVTARASAVLMSLVQWLSPSPVSQVRRSGPVNNLAQVLAMNGGKLPSAPLPTLVVTLLSRQRQAQASLPIAPCVSPPLMARRAPLSRRVMPSTMLVVLVPLLSVALPITTLSPAPSPVTKRPSAKHPKTFSPGALPSPRTRVSV